MSAPVVFLCIICILTVEALIMLGPPLATLSDLLAVAPLSFIAGMVAGFLAADRYRLTRRHPTENE